MTSAEGISDAEAAMRDAIRSIDAIGEGASGREQRPPQQGGRASTAEGSASAGNASAVGDSDA